MPAATIVADSFAARITQVLERFPNHSQLARKVGVSEGTLRRWRKGRTEARRDHLVAFALATGVDVQWLATGAGSPSPDTANALQDRQEEPCVNIALLMEVMTCVDHALAAAQKTMETEKKSEVIGLVYRVSQYQPRETLPEIAAHCVRLAS